MFILASYRDFAVQSGTYCHKDSLFKDKVKPMRTTSDHETVPRIERYKEKGRYKER